MMTILFEEEFENQHNDPVDINGSHENVNGVDLLTNHNMKAANKALKSKK